MTVGDAEPRAPDSQKSLLRWSLRLRTGTKMSVVEGRAHKSPSRRYKSIEQWDVLILDHHSGYICWEQYLKNRKLMAENLAQREGEGTGAAKNGAALLSGLLRCGRCGRKMQVIYSGRRGQVARYGCCGARELRGSSSCLSMGSLRTDRAVVEEVLQAIEPAGIEAALKPVSRPRWKIKREGVV